MHAKEATLMIEENFKQKKEMADFRPGDLVRVHAKITESTAGDDEEEKKDGKKKKSAQPETKDRIQIFEGTVVKTSGSGLSKTFTVRKISNNIGVEVIYPFHSPRVTKVEVVNRGRVRRARLYYLRDRSGKAARVENLDQFEALNVTAESPSAAPKRNK